MDSISLPIDFPNFASWRLKLNISPRSSIATLAGLAVLALVTSSSYFSSISCGVGRVVANVIGGQI